jgi:hypothetical protein
MFWIYTLAFFIIINILLINIFFGIIIDTFGELRDENEEKKQVFYFKFYFNTL